MNELHNNERKKILSITNNNILRTWPEDCFLISIIQNNPKSYDWIMNSFVQICTYKSTHDNNSFRINFLPSGKHHYPINLYDYCPFIDKYVIHNNLIIQLFQKYTDFLIFAINNGYYVSCSLDQFFRKQNKTYGQYHPNYIYGYNIIDKKIYLADHFDSGKFSFLNIPFDDVDKSFNMTNKYSNYDFNHKTYLYKLKDCEYYFDTLKLANLLEDYLNSCDSTDYKSKHYNNKFYGIECYKLFYPYLMSIISNSDQFIDLRSFVFLIDHKKIMLLRIQYMLANNYLPLKIKSLEDEYRKLTKQCERILLLAIKYNNTKNAEIIDKIVNYLKLIVTNDFSLTSKLLDETRKLV